MSLSSFQEGFGAGMAHINTFIKRFIDRSSAATCPAEFQGPGLEPVDDKGHHHRAHVLVALVMIISKALRSFLDLLRLSVCKFSEHSLSLFNISFKKLRSI